MKGLRRFFPFFLVFLIALYGWSFFQAPPSRSKGVPSKNGFNISYSLVPIDEILSGGPPRDGIPALTHPKTLSAKKASYLAKKDLVIGVRIKGKSRAYPIRILMWHENVNDTLGGVPIAVSYCPLCNSAFVFHRKIGGKVREFGISGLLWNSNVLLYDRQKRGQESLWSQIFMKAVTGPAARQRLKLSLLPAELTSWGAWRRAHPKTTVLSLKTGFPRSYSSSPYQHYFATDELMFPAKQKKKNVRHFKNKELMVIVQTGKTVKAYAVKDVATAKSRKIKDVIAGQVIWLSYKKESQSVQVRTANGKFLPTAYLYWFSLSSILPNISVYVPDR